MVVWIIIAVVFVGLMCWGMTPSGRAYTAENAKRKAARQPKKISDVGVQGATGLACPKCGGTQFKAHRKTSTKLALGAASLLGEAHWVRCVTCGTDYRRG